MFVSNLLMWSASAIAAGWKTSQLIRVPHDKGLRVVTTCTILVFIALTAQLTVSTTAVSELLPSQSPKLLQNVILTFFFALLIALLQSTQSPSTTGSRGYIEIVLALLASGGLIATFAATAPAVRGDSYEEAYGHASLLTFYLVGNLYMAYATVRGTYLAWTTARHTQSRARLSLRVAAAGLTVCCLGTHVPRVVSTSGRLAFGRDLLPGTATWTTPLLAIGIGAFFLGIGYPGVRTAVAKTLLWFQARHHYRQLRPLWIALYSHFPSIALFPPATELRDAFQITHMRMRYYRRVIECRDGLVCLSPYVDEPSDTAASPAYQAELVRDGLVRCAKGRKVSAVSVIAAPTDAGMDADIMELLALSQAFDRLPQQEVRVTHSELDRSL
ncbi:MAB_1171c family putative transporter [Saccharopolyspora sp. NPDC003762]